MCYALNQDFRNFEIPQQVPAVWKYYRFYQKKRTILYESDLKRKKKITPWFCAWPYIDMGKRRAMSHFKYDDSQKIQLQKIKITTKKKTLTKSQKSNKLTKTQQM